MEMRELLLDKKALTDGKIKLADAPDAELKSRDASGYAKAYGGMQSYESALDAAGYERESDMDDQGARIQVVLCDILDDGTVITASRGREIVTSADEIYDAHGMSVPSLKTEDTPEP